MKTDLGEGVAPALKLSPEERLLLACAAPPERLDPERLSALAAGVTDWPGFASRALGSKLAPLAFARLSGLGLRGTIPRPLYMKLAGVQVAADAMNRRILDERDRLMEAVEDRGLRILPLKGSALADTLYGDLSLRPMGDLDLLVREEELPSLSLLLSEFGYGTDGRDTGGEVLFQHPEHFHIDAHFLLDPSGRFRIPTEELWATAAPLPDGRLSDLIEGPPPPRRDTLSVQHHFAHSLIHAARHRLDSLVPLVDASWIAARWPGEVGWDSLSGMARRWRCREALGFAIEAAHLLFGLEVPAEARRGLGLQGWRRGMIARVWPGESPFRSLESRPKIVRYGFSALTTTWPGGFIGALRRFRFSRGAAPRKPSSSEG